MNMKNFYLFPVIPANSTLVNPISLNSILTTKSSFVIWKKNIVRKLLNAGKTKKNLPF